eukprot:CAMPEP_0169448814 /NCGR_PEP_ID=MMETSP1042-20121227/12267_1 /TAXON_ID=464988 /ORGANISM="Hemiselmis andersenii, Strain CCMP1180" /LENGTH=117 /DNA_ID=CAMNT_0009560489 /DNA_START=9 /DNA_END=359 /DNA_ORIENTATION=+
MASFMQSLKTGFQRVAAQQREAQLRAAAQSAEQNSAAIGRSAHDFVASLTSFVPQSLKMIQGAVSGAAANPNPLNWTIGGVKQGMQVFIEVYGAFCIGEVIGKRQLIGYPVKKYWRG